MCRRVIIVLYIKHHLPEKRSAPNTAIKVSVTSPPTKICMNPPSIKIHNPAKSLQRCLKFVNVYNTFKERIHYP